MSLKKGTTIDLTVTSASDPMKVNNTDDELLVTRALIDTTKPSYKPDTSTLSSSSLTPRTVSEYTLYPSSTVTAALR